ncbi:MAG: hypothetical protein Q8S75_16335 [Nitrospirota bacterium]|nr:hypothetical protein [Nitrospirota bacterium]
MGQTVLSLQAALTLVVLTSGACGPSHSGEEQRSASVAASTPDTGDRLDEEQVVRMYRDVVPSTVFLASSYTTGGGPLVNSEGRVVGISTAMMVAHRISGLPFRWVSSKRSSWN